MHMILRLQYLAIAVAAYCCATSIVCGAPERPPYEKREVHDPNGTGTFYLGREIAQVMGHQGADWLERPEREAEENTDRMVELLALKPGEVVADIGAGTGYITRKLAKGVGTNGSVYAVEIQQEMLDILTNKLAHSGIHNVKPALGTVKDPKLPANAMDTILMVDVYHEFDHPYEMMDSMWRSLKPGGRIVFIEYRAEDPKVPIKVVHKMSVEQVRKEAEIFPLKWEKTISDLPRQHMIIFRKAAEPKKPRP
jgi:ubiquinone/menaquinone biosynthesis C-methylase UbiE